MSLGGGGGGGRQQLQQLSQELQEIQSEIEAIEAEIEGLRDDKTAVDEAIDAVEAIDSGDTIQVPLGGGAYVRAEVQDMSEIIVEIGGGYAAERDEDGAVDSLETRKETLDDRIDELNEDIAELESESDQLEQRAQQMQQQQMQQQMQAMQGEGDDEE